MIIKRLARAVLNPGMYAGVLLTVILLVAAYQVRPTYEIPLGTPTDGALLRGFNAGEVSQGDGTLKFRWSTGDAEITLHDLGRQDFDAAITLSGARPPGQEPAKVRVSVADTLLLDVQPPPEVKEYPFRVPRELVEGGTLRLHLTANSFSPPGDPRELGVIVTHLRVAPAPTPDRFIEPPPGPPVAVALASLVLGLAFALLGWGTGAVAVGALLPGLLASWLLVGDRLWLTTGRWYDVWPGVLAAGVVLIAAVSVLGGWLLRRAGTPWHAPQMRALLTLMLLVFAARLAGQLHPQIFIVDLLFHAHRFETVQSGQLLFTIESAEWGGRSTFYLPTPYIFMLPLQWLLNDELLVIKLFTVGLSTLGAFLLYYTGVRALRDGRAGLVAAALYLTVPVAVLPFSWGITSNVFGEFFALASFAIVAAHHSDIHPKRPAFWALFFTLLMALLSHPGVVQLTMVAFGLAAVLWLASRRGVEIRCSGAWMLAALLGAFGFAYLVYYVNFTADMLTTLREIQAERAAAAAPGQVRLRIGGSVSDRSLGLIVRIVETRREWFFGGLRGFWQEAHAYYRVWPLVGAVLGYLLVWTVGRRRAGRGRAVALAALGWLAAVILYALVGWTVNLYVRYALFALPVVALGAAVVLSQLWRRGQAGALLSLLLLLFYAAEALALWQYRITYAFK